MLQDEPKNLNWIKRYPLDLLVDDLRLFVHSVEPDQFDLLKRALEMYRIQSLKQDALKKSYLFGSIVMRVLSHFKMPEVAAQV